MFRYIWPVSNQSRGQSGRPSLEPHRTGGVAQALAFDFSGAPSFARQRVGTFPIRLHFIFPLRMSPVLRLYFRSVATLAPSCYFPARSINMDRSFPPMGGTSVQASVRQRPFVPQGGAEHGARAKRQIPRQPEAGLCRDDRQEEPPHAIGAIQIYSIHVSSKFPANSLKTNDRCPYKPQQKTRPVRPARHDPIRIVIPSEHRESRGGAPIYSTHVPSNFRANSLKTNDGCTREVTHFFETGLPFAPLQPLVPSAVEGREFPESLATRHLPLATNFLQETRAVRDRAAEIFGDGLAHVGERGADAEIHAAAPAGVYARIGTYSREWSVVGFTGSGSQP